MKQATRRRLARLETRRRGSGYDDLDDWEFLQRANDVIARIVAAEGFDRACVLIEAAMIESGSSAAEVTQMQSYIRELRDSGVLPRESGGDG